MGGKIGKVFISYSRTDLAIADRIVDALTNANVDVWIDRREIGLGQSFVERMNQGLEESSYVVLLLSPAALASPWVTREWASSLAARNTAIIPVKVAKVDTPRLLLDKVAIDLTDDLDRGLRELVDFFTREAAPAVRPIKGAPSRALLAGATRYEIRRVAHACVNEAAFRAYLFDVDVDPGSLAGDSLHERILNFLHRMDSEGRIKEVLRSIERDCGPCVRTQLQRARQDQAKVDGLEF